MKREISVWNPRHPVWKLAQMAGAIVVLTLAVAHSYLSHHGGVDSTDVVGSGGALWALRIAASFFKEQ